MTLHLFLDHGVHMGGVGHYHAHHHAGHTTFVMCPTSGDRPDLKDVSQCPENQGGAAVASAAVLFHF